MTRTFHLAVPQICIEANVPQTYTEVNEVRTLLQWSTICQKIYYKFGTHDKNASVMHNKKNCVATKVIFYSLNNWENSIL